MRGHPRAVSAQQTRLQEQEAFDRDAEAMSEVLVINVSPYEARFEIASTPGTKPRRYKLDPGRTVHLQSGYCEEFIGASRQPVRATIESLTEIEVFPRGPRLPMVVRTEKAHEMRDKWERALAKADAAPAPIKVMMAASDGGEPVEMTVQPSPQAHAPRPPMAPMASLDDDEDQAGPLDEPPPDHNEPLEPVTLPAATGPAPTSGGKRGGRG